MSIFGLYFVGGLLREMGWPRTRGLFRKREYIDAAMLDATVDQMIDYAAARGACRPNEALQMIAEMFRDRDWSGDDRPKIAVFVEGMRTQSDDWKSGVSVAPHDVIKRRRFSEVGARAPAQILSEKEVRVRLEELFFEGLCWGLANPKAVEAWYAENYSRNVEIFDMVQEAGVEWDQPYNLAQLLADSDPILENYQREVGVLPAIPNSLIEDARALGRRII